MTNDIIAKLRKCLKVGEHAVRNKPVIFLDKKGSNWKNHAAEKFLNDNKIPVKEFMEWLLIGSSHFQNLSYGNITVKILGLPGDSVLFFLKHGRNNNCKEYDKFTVRERQVLGYLVKGFSNKKIATLMKITPGTVNTHLDNIYEKMGCSNRQVAAIAALKQGLFVPSAKSLKPREGGA